MPRNLATTNSPTQQNTGAESKTIEIVKDKLNVKISGVQKTAEKNTKTPHTAWVQTFGKQLRLLKKAVLHLSQTL